MPIAATSSLKHPDMLQLRPSSSHLWSGDVPCNAAPRFIANIPVPPPSDPAREGTCAAWVAEMVLTGEVACAADLIGKSHENGWLVEPEMARIIQRYIDHLTSRGGSIHTERKVRLNKMIAGTPDAFAVLDETGTLYVDDLKYGYDIVDPYRNTQISIYAGAIMRMIRNKIPKIRKVVIGVYQPRADHPSGIYRTWTVWPEELMKFVQKIERDGEDAQALDSVATPGFHCEHCPAAATCHALTKTIYKGFRVATDERQGHMSADQMSEELTFLAMMEKLLKARANAVRAEATARIKRSEFIRGWTLDSERFGNKKFSIPANAVALRTGVYPYEDPKVCTPAELLRRGADPDVVAGITTRPRIPAKLVQLDSDHFKRAFAQKGENE